MKADLNLAYKMSKGSSFLEFDHFFERVGERRRLRAPHELRPCKLNKVKTGQCFAARVVHPWNSLPAEVVNAQKLSTFKSSLDRVDLTNHLRGSGVRAPQ